MVEIGRFRTWAGSNPSATRSQEQPFYHSDGEWECDYPHWSELYAAVMAHTAANLAEDWSDEQSQAVLYALARDNEDEFLAQEIREQHPARLIALAKIAVVGGEFDARWQLAEQLGHLTGNLVDVEPLLLAFASDEDEYVRRRALRSLARKSSPEVEHLALEAWNRPDEQQEYARMMVLHCLHLINSPHLEPLLAEAELDEGKYLRNSANRIRLDRAEPDHRRDDPGAAGSD